MVDFSRLEAWLDRLLDNHIELFNGNVEQGSAEWHANRTKIVGGSELATLLGWNSFMKWDALIAKKLGLSNTSSPGVACWWGSMFEPVSERIVELHCSTTVKGTSIHMRYPRLKHHANSPDGYCVIRFREAEDAWEIAHGPGRDAEEDASFPPMPMPVLIELKAPYSRLPDGQVPKCYLPQVWSGLELSPVALRGVFVEVVYRLCALDQLGPSAAYSTNYHRKDSSERNRGRTAWEGSFAWGATAVYAPKLGTRSATCGSATTSSASWRPKASAASADVEAYRLLCDYFGEPISGEELGHRLLDAGDLADTRPSSFDALMKMVDTKSVKIRHSDPQFAEAAEADTPHDLDLFMQEAESGASCPEDHYLLGYIPWKVFQVDYHVVHRRPGFLDEIIELTDRFMGEVSQLLEAEDVAKAYCEHCQKKAVASGKAPSAPKVSSSARQALFARVGAATAAEEAGS